MPLLAEYALTPDVFDTDLYNDEDLADSRMDLLREALFNEGIVRDLRDGEWKNVFSNPGRNWYRRGKELLKKLSTQGRIRNFPGVLPHAPACDADWINEALASHDQQGIEGIITSDVLAANHADKSVVASISKLSRANWWGERGATIRVDRKVDAYQEKLSLLFSCSNHLMFLDPNLDPTKANYRDFTTLFQFVNGRDPLPSIEVHRTITEGAGPGRRVLSQGEWERRFRSALQPILPADATVEVFLWDEMHDRYLLSNIIGISLPYGFDTSRRQFDMTTWTRLDRSVRDDVMREFDPHSHRHKLQGNFKI